MIRPRPGPPRAIAERELTRGLNQLVERAISN